MDDHLKYIQKLNGDNYGIWKVRMKAFLVNKNLWSVIDPNAVVTGTPEEPREILGAASTDPVPSGQSDSSRADLTHKSQQALSLIILGLDDHQIIHVDGCLTGRDAWNKLQKLYEEPSTANKMRLYERFLTLKLEKNVVVRTHVEQFASIRSQLKSVGVSIDDGLYKLALLRSLSSKFDNLVVTLENQIDSINVEDLHARVYREEVRQDTAENDSSQLLSAHVKPNYRFGNKHSRNVKCYYCNKTGHIKPNCWKWKQDQTRGKSGNSRQQNTTGHFLLASENIRDDNVKPMESVWFVDSGASFHLCHNKILFKNVLRQLNHPKIIKLGDGSQITADYEGDIDMECSSIFGKFQLRVRNVLYVPQAKVNLLSVAQIQKNGYSILFENNECVVSHKASGTTVLHIPINGTGFMFDCIIYMPTGEAFLAKKADNNSMIWHRRLGHCGIKVLHELKKQDLISSGIGTADETEVLSNCKACDLGKMTNQTYRTSVFKSKGILELIHTDLCGPMKVESLGKAKYFLLFVDDFSRMTFVYFVRSKRDVKDVIKTFIQYVERQSGKKVKRIRSDNGGEYTSNSLAEFFRCNGIVHERSAPYTPQQNGVAERSNRILIEKARCMLHDGKMPLQFWADAVSTAAYLRNLTPSSSLNWKTPKEVYTGRKPRISHLRVFGSSAQVFIPIATRSKWDATSRMCMFIGYTLTDRNYRFYNQSTRKVIIGSHAKFYENTCGFHDHEHNTTWKLSDLIELSLFESEDVSEIGAISATHNEHHVDNNHLPTYDIGEGSHSTSSVQDPQASEIQDNPSDEPMATTTRSGRISRQPPRLTYEHCVTDDEDADVATMYTAFEPQSFIEAVCSPQKDEWKAAMNREMEALIHKGTWDLVDVAPEQKVIDCRWVYVLKHSNDGQKPSFKARLVAKGFSQTYGVEYFDTFAPVARLSSTRLLLAIALDKQAYIHQMDVKNAFINGFLKEDLYMHQPEGFIDETYPNRVCKLNRAIYGLKQAAREWYETIENFLREIYLTCTKTDQGIFCGMIDGFTVRIVLYVDDILIITEDRNVLHKIKDLLSSKFDMKDLGCVRKFIGMNIEYNREMKFMRLDQCSKIDEVITRYGMQKCNGIRTPLHVSFASEIRVGSEKCSSIVPYREAIGSLLYVATCTRPDILYAVNILSKYCEFPERHHWTLVKRIIRYLKQTRHYALVYNPTPNNNLTAFSDADWAGLSDRKSTSGLAIYYKDCLIGWRSKRQSIVALSTTESEMIALVEGYKEFKYFKKLLFEVGSDCDEYHIYCDNQPCITIAHKNGYNGRSKHIDLRYLAIQDFIQKKEFQLLHCSSRDMVADIFTKSLSPVLHNQIVQNLCLDTSH